MKLHENQLNLIRHLIRFNLMTYEDCLEMLDVEPKISAEGTVFRNE